MSNISRWDGSIQSTNLPTASTMRPKDNNIYRCMVIDVQYVDDEKNITKNAKNKQVTYTVVVLGGFREGQLISNVRSIFAFGGVYNYHEKIYRKTKFKLNEKPLSQHDGDIVYVMFIQGDPVAPVIIGPGTSTGENSLNAATKSDGPRCVKQFNGIYTEINKEGELFLIRKGGAYNSDKDYFIPVDEEESDLEETDEFQSQIYLKANEMMWQDPQSSIQFLKEEKLWTHKVGKNSDKTKDLYTEIVDGENEKTIRTYDSGLEIIEDGKGDKVTIETNAGIKVTIDGSGNNIILTAGSTKITIDGSSGKIHLDGDLIDLGASVSDMVTKFTQLAAAYNSHTHQYIDTSDAGAIPSVTQPPLATLLSTVGSQTVKVQD